MRCKACDSMLKDTAPFWREVDVDGKAVRMVEDMCPDCRSFIVEEDDVLEFDWIHVDKVEEWNE